jgi:hypothetical protein
MAIGAIGGLFGGAAAICTAFRFRTIEELRTGLRKEVYKHETRFSRLHHLRVEVIAALYERLVVEMAVQRVIQPFARLAWSPSTSPFSEQLKRATI